MAWTTPDQVLALTGETVSAANVALASAMIDTYTGASEDMPADAVTARDRRTLGKATAWQAVWVRDRPGILSNRESATGSSADGVSLQREARSDVMLAPMASREVRNLSWVGTRTQVLLPDSTRLGKVNFLNEESDDHGTWRSL